MKKLLALLVMVSFIGIGCTGSPSTPDKPAGTDGKKGSAKPDKKPDMAPDKKPDMSHEKKADPVPEKKADPKPAEPKPK